MVYGYNTFQTISYKDKKKKLVHLLWANVWFNYLTMSSYPSDLSGPRHHDGVGDGGGQSDQWGNVDGPAGPLRLHAVFGWREITLDVREGKKKKRNKKVCLFVANIQIQMDSTTTRGDEAANGRNSGRTKSPRADCLPAGCTASRWLSHTDWAGNGLPEDSWSPTGKTATGLALKNHIWSPRCPFEGQKTDVSPHGCRNRARLDRGEPGVLHRAADLLDLLWRQRKGETRLLKSLAVVRGCRGRRKRKETLF